MSTEGLVVGTLRAFRKVRCARGHEYDESVFFPRRVTFYDGHSRVLAEVDIGCFICLAETLRGLAVPVEEVS